MKFTITLEADDEGTAFLYKRSEQHHAERMAEAQNAAATASTAQAVLDALGDIRDALHKAVSEGSEPA